MNYKNYHNGKRLHWHISFKLGSVPHCVNTLADWGTDPII